MFFVTIRPDYYFLHCNLQVRVRVSDLLGRSLGKMEVTVESGMRSSDGLTIMSQTKMSESKKDRLADRHEKKVVQHAESSWFPTFVRRSDIFCLPTSPLHASLLSSMEDLVVAV